MTNGAAGRAVCLQSDTSPEGLGLTAAAALCSGQATLSSGVCQRRNRFVSSVCRAPSSAGAESSADIAPTESGLLCMS